MLFKMLKAMLRILLFLFCSVMISCGGNSAKKSISADEKYIDSLETEVMRIHDESMLGMSDLKAIKKELFKIDKKDLTPELQMALVAAREELVLADSLMWDWMHNWSAPDKTKTKAAITYLEEEYKKISRVDDLMNSSISKGDQLYNRIKKMVDEK